jgi:hypothetical protein
MRYPQEAYHLYKTVEQQDNHMSGVGDIKESIMYNMELEQNEWRKSH